MFPIHSDRAPDPDPKSPKSWLVEVFNCLVLFFCFQKELLYFVKPSAFCSQKQSLEEIKLKSSRTAVLNAPGGTFETQRIYESTWDKQHAPSTDQVRAIE